MDEWVGERRRFPRVPIDGRQELVTGHRVRVRLMDISATGALIACDERLPVGSRGRLHLVLGAAPFDAVVEVKREARGAAGKGWTAGVSMVSPERPQQVTLEDFLLRAGE